MCGVLGSHISDDAAFPVLGIWEFKFRQNLYWVSVVWALVPRRSSGFGVLDFEF